MLTQTKRRQSQLACHRGELHDALVGFAVTPATNGELVQVFVRPPHDYLDDIVQLRERQVLGNDDAPPPAGSSLAG